MVRELPLQKSHILFGERFRGISHKELSDSQQQRPVGSATECDGPEDSPGARMIDNTSRHAPPLHGIGCDKLQVQASSLAALRGSTSECDLHFFKELLPLRLR
jgi:hypothetical protein